MSLGVTLFYSSLQTMSSTYYYLIRDTTNHSLDLALLNLSIYGNILFERTRVISINSNMKMFFNNDISDHGDAVISRSRIIFFKCSLL